MSTVRSMQPTLDGRLPEPGGWKRIQRAADASLRNEIVTGRGGRRILVDDPSGTCFERFEPAAREA